MRISNMDDYIKKAKEAVKQDMRDHDCDPDKTIDQLFYGQEKAKEGFEKSKEFAKDTAKNMGKDAKKFAETHFAQHSGGPMKNYKSVDQAIKDAEKQRDNADDERYVQKFWKFTGEKMDDIPTDHMDFIFQKKKVEIDRSFVDARDDYGNIILDKHGDPIKEAVFSLKIDGKEYNRHEKDLTEEEKKDPNICSQEKKILQMCNAGSQYSWKREFKKQVIGTKNEIKRDAAQEIPREAVRMPARMAHEARTTGDSLMSEFFQFLKQGAGPMR